jgi:hypothetical protein
MQDDAAEPQQDDAPETQEIEAPPEKRERAATDPLHFPPSGEKGWG